MYQTIAIAITKQIKKIANTPHCGETVNDDGSKTSFKCNRRTVWRTTTIPNSDTNNIAAAGSIFFLKKKCSEPSERMIDRVSQ